MDSINANSSFDGVDGEHLVTTFSFSPTDQIGSDRNLTRLPINGYFVLDTTICTPKPYWSGKKPENFHYLIFCRKALTIFYHLSQVGI